MAKTATVEPNADLLARCEHALELLLTHRGNPSAEIDRVLADDPQCVFGHCLRAAIIVRADATAARSTLAASVAAIEAACPDMDDPARRHAAAARAWLEGDSGSCGRTLRRHRHRLAARHSRARGRACARLPPRPATHDARSYRPGAARMGRRDARLRERPCDVRVRASRRTASIVVPKRWRGARSPSIPDIRAPFTLSPT